MRTRGSAKPGAGGILETSRFVLLRSQAASVARGGARLNHLCQPMRDAFSQASDMINTSSVVTHTNSEMTHTNSQMTQTNHGIFK